MRFVLLGLSCAVLLLSSMAAAAEGGAPGEEVMESSGMPQAPAGNGEHALCWLEIAAKDLAASREFYGKLFGWTFQDVEGMPGYVMYMPSAGIAGALTAMPESLENPQQTVPYLLSSDIDADLAALEARGATIVQPKTPVFDWGFVALFVDHAGTSYGLSTMAPQIPVPHVPTGLGAGPKPAPGAVCSIELYGGDFEQVKALFGEHFGWGLLEAMPQYMMFDPGAGASGVFQSHTAVAKSMPYIYVEDVHAKIAEIEAAGGKRIGDPMAMPGMGTFGYFTDPSGVGMGLIGP